MSDEQAKRAGEGDENLKENSMKNNSGECVLCVVGIVAATYVVGSALIMGAAMWFGQN